MPLIQITLIEGRDGETITQCAKAVARTVHNSLGAPLESIRVVVNQVPASQWIVGERSKAEIDAGKERT
ncbi:tautomerase family protein [Paracandidimonas soli]|uniref:4-oxalocrotonate tautomerase n=1 Tax=Paracandidimonas soli TaxID=1917182 RepID=A0A4R3UZ23_9BURK|nr:tautomerase family protein [Paracandidimonas soli]TCU96067.1 4-oxalocrotonate tautomerase [Paracandidimonas soli]